MAPGHSLVGLPATETCWWYSMRRRRVMMVLQGAAAAWCAAPLAVAGAVPAGVAPGAAGAVISAGIWRKAIEVPGSSALNKGGNADVNSVSCASAGNCAAVGFYRDGSGRGQVFVVSEREGHWRKGIEVPGSGALNQGGNALAFSVSCASAGNCAAAGDYLDGSGLVQAFVVSEREGHWRKAIEVPGSGALNQGANQSAGAQAVSVSCASAGNCAAVGFYTDGAGHVQAFVVSEREGHWRKAIEVPGSGALNKDGEAQALSVSCASAGNCAAVGFYRDGSGRKQAFVVSEREGHWRKAIEVPGSGALNKGGAAESFSV